MFPLSDRMKLISESITLAVSAKANAMKKAGIDVVGFGAGEPDFDTPAFIKDAAKTALDKGQTKYTPTPCLPELREAIAKKFNVENGLPYKPDQITTGSGGKHCLYMAFMAVLNPGDEVIIPAPYWVSYPEQVKLAGGVSKFVRGEESAGFKITPAQLSAAITPKTKVLIINSPSNPGGHAYSPAELKALADVAAKHPHLVIFSDEIYEKLVYDGLKSVSFATLHPDLLERTLTFNCHSKSFAMTGWRIGYIGGPKPVIDAINKLQSQMTSHITSFMQMPAALALTDRAAPKASSRCAANSRNAPSTSGSASPPSPKSPASAPRARFTFSPTSAPISAKPSPRPASPMRSLSPPPCWNRATSPSSPATTAASTPTFASASPPAWSRSTKGSTASRNS